MGIIETILLAVLSILLMGLSYALFIPITVHVDVLIDERVAARSSVKAYPFKRQLYPRSPEPEKIPKSERPAKGKAQLGKKKGLDLTALNRTDISILLGVVGEAFKMLGRIFKAPNYYLVANLAGGTEEPDVTGQLYGAYHAIRPNLPAGLWLNYVPDFLVGRFAGNISCGLVVTVFGLLKEVVIFIIRLPIIKLFKLYRKLKKGRTHVK